MTRLGIRLAFAGGRAGVAAQVLTALALAAGTALLLVALAVPSAYTAREARSALFGSDVGAAGLVLPGERPESFAAVRESDDAFGDRSISVIEVAGVGPRPPAPAGMDLPPVGELRISPALAALAEREPLLAERYPAGTAVLAETVVPTPETLLAVRGSAAPPDVLDNRGWRKVHAFPATRLDSAIAEVSLAAAVGSVAVLAPVMVLMGAATRLTAAGRDRRMAALRLAGASTGQVARLVAVESALVGLLGAVAGIGVFLALRPLAVYLTLDRPWYIEDLMPPLWAFAAALVGVPLAAALGAVLALQRVAVSPLGVGRSTRARPLRAWRLVPVVVAVPAIAVVAHDSTGPDSVLPVLVALLMVIASLLLAGPWLVRLLGALLARSGVAAAMLAGRRLTTDPRAGFRAASGGVLGAFAVSLFLTITPAQSDFAPPVSAGSPDTAMSQEADPAVTEAADRVLAATPGVTPTTLRTAYLPGFAGLAWIGDCPALAVLAAVDPGRCAPGRVLVAPATIGLDRLQYEGDDVVPVRGEVVVALPPGGNGRPSAILPVTAVANPLPETYPGAVAVVAVTPEALERARTALFDAGLPIGLDTPALRDAVIRGTFSGAARMLVLAMLLTYLVAGCSAAVAAAGGLLQRRRSFALLRLTGTPVGVLRWSAALELALPLVVLSAVAALLGAATAKAVQVGSDIEEDIPWSALAGPVAVGVLIALTLGSAALPLVRRLTAGETTRFA